MIIEIKTVDEQIVQIDSHELYEALAKINNLTELTPNHWIDVYGQYWILTAQGFKRVGSSI